MRVEEACGFGKGAKPEVGMPCTLHLYSDSQACEVVKVSKSGKTCWIRRNVITVDPSSEGGIGHQDWVIHKGEFVKIWSDPKTFKDYTEPQLANVPDNYSYYKVTLRKDGSWRTSKSNEYVQLGVAHEYYDWSF